MSENIENNTHQQTDRDAIENHVAQGKEQGLIKKCFKWMGKYWGRLLIILLVLWVGYLFSLPSSSTVYEIRARVATGMIYGSSLFKQKLVDYYGEHGRWPEGQALDALSQNVENLGDNEIKKFYPDMNSKQLKKIVKRIQVLPDGVIQVAYTKKYNNGSIYMRPIHNEKNNQVEWKCESPDMPRPMLPAECR